MSLLPTYHWDDCVFQTNNHDLSICGRRIRPEPWRRCRAYANTAKVTGRCLLRHGHEGKHRTLHPFFYENASSHGNPVYWNWLNGEEVEALKSRRFLHCVECGKPFTKPQLPEEYGTSFCSAGCAHEYYYREEDEDDD